MIEWKYVTGDGEDMDLEDRIAIAALEVCANHQIQIMGSIKADKLAKDCYDIVDAMMYEREKRINKEEEQDDE